MHGKNNNIRTYRIFPGHKCYSRTTTWLSSKEVNLLTRLNEWTLMDDNQESTDVIYLHIKKAFDKIPTKFLIYKLNHYGAKGNLLQLNGEGLLEGRMFQVRVDSALSQDHQVSSGVP